ncbi:MAG: YihY/virulence factor BrkB family protein [Clostridiales bacterium]|jgi:membrane protein|nr:YihY/virulence factor BrkB family protein [Clostridiales bacterium]
MKKFTRFAHALYGKIKENEILPLATQLTYRLVFALFPFIIFLISLVGYFDIDAELLLQESYDVFPQQIAQVINDVIRDVVDTRNPSIMSTSLLLSVFTVASGFNSIMHGVSKVYGQEDTRGIIARWLCSIVLVVALAFAIISSLLVVIYGDTIYGMIYRHLSPHRLFSVIFGFAGLMITIAIMLATIMLIYILSLNKRQSIVSMLPGAMLTIVVWAISSSAFNFYVNNFSRYSLVYGSIASIFITMLWLNIVSATILIGAQTNALLNIKGD